MQQIHAKHDLLQRTRRHGADEDGLEAGQRIRLMGHGGGQTAKIDRHGIVAELRRGALQIADVPTIASR